MTLREGSRILKSENVSVLPYTHISHVRTVQIMFRSVGNVASRQMRPETRVGLRMKYALHCPILTKIHKCGRKVVPRVECALHRPI